MSRIYFSLCLLLLIAAATNARAEQFDNKMIEVSSEPLIVEHPDSKNDTQTDLSDSVDKGATAVSGTIRRGSHGERVKKLQQQLKALGYYSGDITGNTGSLTVEAIKRFQRANGLEVDGIAGVKTLTAIQRVAGGDTVHNDNSNSDKAARIVSSVTPSTGKNTGLIKSGSQGDDVLELQTKLKILGFYTGSLTGKAGSLTINAIKRFQRSTGLKADGIAGEKTLSAVAKAIEGQTIELQNDQMVTTAETLRNESTEDQARETNAKNDKDQVNEDDMKFVIKLGTQGDEIKKLQQNLKMLGYYNGSVTGKCGTLTLKAIEKFQKDNGLPTEGTVGEATLSAINSKLQQESIVKVTTTVSSTLMEGGSDERYDLIPSLKTVKELKRYSAGNDVTSLQKALKALDYFAGYETGFYGDYTQERVKMFQQDHGLNPTGIADALTLEAVNRALRNQ